MHPSILLRTTQGAVKNSKAINPKILNPLVLESLIPLIIFDYL